MTAMFRKSQPQVVVSRICKLVPKCWSKVSRDGTMKSVGGAARASRNLFDSRTTSVIQESDYPKCPRRRGLRSLTGPKVPRPSRAELERACRIALMETEQPVCVEAIYDRIVRRESFVFLSHKRPFRAIALAMATLVRRGEAILLVERDEVTVLRSRSRRVWCRAIAFQPKVTHPPEGEESGLACIPLCTATVAPVLSVWKIAIGQSQDSVSHGTESEEAAQIDLRCRMP